MGKGPAKTRGQRAATRAPLVVRTTPQQEKQLARIQRDLAPQPA